MRNDADFLKSVFQQSIIERSRESVLYEDRTEIDILNIHELATKILLLPEYMRSLLFLKYIFYFAPNEVERILSISQAKQKLQYAELLLAYLLNLSDMNRISNTCMEKAASQAFSEYNLIGETTSIKRNYSVKFRKQLKEIKAAQKYRNHITLKRVGIALIAAILSFAMTLTVSAELRERFVSWLVETFPLFSQFTSVSEVQPNQSDFERLRNMRLDYIPNGFVLIDNFEADPMVTYRYEDLSGNFLSINASLSTGSPVLADTEGVNPQKIIFNNQIAYWWEKDDLCYFIWQQDVFELNIIGQISYENVIKIAENIKI